MSYECCRTVNLPVFSRSVLGVFGLLIISVSCVNTSGMNDSMAGPNHYKKGTRFTFNISLHEYVCWLLAGGTIINLPNVSMIDCGINQSNQSINNHTFSTHSLSLSLCLYLSVCMSVWLSLSLSHTHPLSLRGGVHVFQGYWHKSHPCITTTWMTKNLSVIK